MFLFKFGLFTRYADCFLDGPGQAPVLPPYDVEIVKPKP